MKPPNSRGGWAFRYFCIPLRRRQILHAVTGWTFFGPLSPTPSMRSPPCGNRMGDILEPRRRISSMRLCSEWGGSCVPNIFAYLFIGSSMFFGWNLTGNSMALVISFIFFVLWQPLFNVRLWIFTQKLKLFQSLLAFLSQLLSFSVFLYLFCSS